MAADDSLRAVGVHEIRATGSLEDATVTFFDERSNVLGGGRLQTSEDHTLSEIRWRGVTWEVEAAGEEAAGGGARADEGTIEKDGVCLEELDAHQTKQLEEAQTVLLASVELANLSSGLATAKAKKCKKKDGFCGIRSKCCPGFHCVAAGWRGWRCRR